MRFSSRYLAVLPSLQLLLPGSITRLPVDPLLKVGYTPYDVLQKKFDSAKPVTIREVSGWYAGRCYFSDLRMRPVPALLATHQDSASEMGPAFSTSDYTRITPLIAKDDAATALDHLDEPQIGRINAVLKKEENSNAYPINSGGSLIVEGMRSTDYESRNYAIRKLGKILMLRLTCNEDSFCRNYINGAPTNRVIAESGESSAICYYFRKVR